MLKMPSLKNDPSKYHPELCGDCRHFKAWARTAATGGRLVGECERLDCRTYRTDWCHDPVDIAKRKAAMDVYVVGGKRHD